MARALVLIVQLGLASIAGLPAIVLLYLGAAYASSTTTLYGDTRGFGLVLILVGIALLYLTAYLVRIAVRNWRSSAS